MKKLIYLIVLALILGLFLTGCLLSNVGQVPVTEQSGITYLTKGTATDPDEYDLYAGQDILVGTVNVWNDGVELHVTYNTTDGWVLTETHLAVATSIDGIPHTKNDNPIPGKFPYKHENLGGVISDSYIIPLNGWGVGEELYIAAHAKVQKTTLITAAPYYASTVVDYSQGLRKDGTSVLTGRSTPAQGLVYEAAQAESSFFSLGFGGWIIVSFDCPIRNGDGNDVKIIEDTWSSYPLEKADIYASQDNVTWTLLGVADNIHFVGIHTISEFDLGTLLWAKYIKIIDTSDLYVHNAAADGYDLNAVESLQDCVEIQEETAWGAKELGQLQFDGNNWATYFTYESETWTRSGEFTSQRYLPGLWEYNVSFTKSFNGDFSHGTIVLTDPNDLKIEADVLEIEYDYKYWKDMGYSPNYAAVGTATYEYDLYNGNFMFLIADEYIWMALSENDYSPGPWDVGGVWQSDRDYDILSLLGSYW
jgi:hypothetical protein